MKLADYTDRPKPKRCDGSDPATYPEWFSDGCYECGAKYHCPKCGGGVSMMGHYVELDDFEGYWCDEI